MYFDLAIHASQVVGGPFFERLEQIGRQAQRERLSTLGSHRLSCLDNYLLSIFLALQLRSKLEFRP